MTMFHRATARRNVLIAMVAMMALPVTIATSAPMATPDALGIISPTGYRSPQLGYHVTWTDPWHLPEGEGTVPASTEPGQWDRLVLLHGTDRGDVPVTQVTAYVEIVGARVAAGAASPTERWQSWLDYWQSPEYAGGATVSMLFASVDDRALVALMTIDDHLRLVQVTTSASGEWDLTVEVRGRAPVVLDRYESAAVSIEIDGRAVFSQVAPEVVTCLGTAATPEPARCP